MIRLGSMLLPLALGLLVSCDTVPIDVEGPDRDDDTDDDDTGDDDDMDDDDSGGDDDTTEGDGCTAAGNLGTEFWAVDLDNAENAYDDAASGQFAVAVAHVEGDGATHVVVEINEADPGQPLDLQEVDSVDIQPGASHLFLLPRRDADGENATDGNDDGPQTWLSSRAFRIRSDLPVAAFQFNPWDQRFANDATLLLPTEQLGTAHAVVSFPPSAPAPEPGPANRTYVTVVGTVEGTEVQVTPTRDLASGEGVPPVIPGVGVQEGTTGSFMLGPFDTLNLETTLDNQHLGGDWGDLTGTVIGSTAPVAVFSGVDLAHVTGPQHTDACCADHIEQQVPPDHSAGTRFVVPHSAQRATVYAECDVYRILAVEDTTTVTTSLPAPDDHFEIEAGRFEEFCVTTGFTLEADRPVHVVQLLVAGGAVEGAPTGLGDPSMVHIPPVEEWRGSHVFPAAGEFPTNYAVVVAPSGTLVVVDGIQVTAAEAPCMGPTSLGTLDGEPYESWTCPLDDGTHEVRAGTDPEDPEACIAAIVYGYDESASVAFAGG